MSANSAATDTSGSRKRGRRMTTTDETDEHVCKLASFAVPSGIWHFPESSSAHRLDAYSSRVRAILSPCWVLGMCSSLHNSASNSDSQLALVAGGVFGVRLFLRRVSRLHYSTCDEGNFHGLAVALSQVRWALSRRASMRISTRNFEPRFSTLVRRQFFVCLSPEHSEDWKPATASQALICASVLSGFQTMLSVDNGKPFA